MKSLKSNNTAPFQHFLRERLKERKDRAALNVSFNKLANSVARKGGTKNRLKTAIVFDSTNIPSTGVDIHCLDNVKDDQMAQILESHLTNRKEDMVYFSLFDAWETLRNGENR